MDRLFADLHSHFLLNARYLGRDFDRVGRDAFPWGPFGNRLCLEGARKGGVGLVTFAAYAPASPVFWVSRVEATLAQFRAFDRIVAAAGGRLRAVRTGTEARAAALEGAVGGVLAVEGGHSLGGDLANLDVFARRGVRLLTLTHFVPNDLADAAEFPWRPHGGLSALGRRALVSMARLGILPDVAHASDAVARQVLDAFPGPVLSSHTGMRALCDRPRNLPDELARGIARSGGLVGIILFPPYLGGPLRGSLDRLLDHLVHAASVAGPDHVAIGSDLDAFTWTPAGIGGHADFPRIAEGLSCRGFSDGEVGGIMGGNVLRVLDWCGPDLG